MNVRASDRVRFAGFELDLQTGELSDGHARSMLQHQPFHIMRLLIEADGQLVEHEEIRKKLWPNDTVVEFDHSINAAIKNLRRVLGDSADAPRYIETLPRRGYRLMVPTEWIKQPTSNGEIAAPEMAATAQRDSAAGLVGRKVSHYRVLEVIGGGGMGMVYKAEDLKLGRRVALKFLPEELANDPVALQRFEREAQTASSLNHPNICTIYEVEERDGQPFIVMELLDDETLRDRLVNSGDLKFRLGELLDIALQICEGLQAAHEQGILHRDIKPANIFLTTSGRVGNFVAREIGTLHPACKGGRRRVVPRHAKRSVPLVNHLSRLPVRSPYEQAATL